MVGDKVQQLLDPCFWLLCIKMSVCSVVHSMLSGAESCDGVIFISIRVLGSKKTDKYCLTMHSIVTESGVLFYLTHKETNKGFHL